LNVIRGLPQEIDSIIIVDDACPEGTSKLVIQNIKDKRVHVLRHDSNLGVGGAMKTGYALAIEQKLDAVIKIDGDGQMDPRFIDLLVEPVLNLRSEYTKGNRFYSIQLVRNMPKIRIFGNIALSFMSKLSTGYYDLFDPNNGFTAISRDALQRINLDDVDNRYFFESDMLFQLNLAGASVKDIPIPAIYGNEKSNLSITHSTGHFFWKHSRNFLKRVTYEYFIRDFSVASLQLIFGAILSCWGGVLGLVTWVHSTNSGLPSQPGTIVLVAILCVSGLQLLLSFLNFDITSHRRSKN
jgi:glycosyltransferase involved in cell wall biosynthesis